MSADVSAILLKQQTTTHNMFQPPIHDQAGRGLGGVQILKTKMSKL